MDVLVANFSSNNVSLLRGNGDGTFGSATNFPAGNSAVDVAPGDLNGDGNKDLTSSALAGVAIHVRLPDGDSSFGSATSLGTTTLPSGVAVADFNADGHQDVAVAIYEGAGVQVFTATATGPFDQLELLPSRLVPSESPQQT